jgi:5-formyltetrahydrofolate cyclo-ligase
VSFSDDKQTLREEIWIALEESGDDRFPGARGRIPNFTGREEAAERLFQQSVYREADRIKINPDSPQTPVREQALRDGKTLYMAVPRLKEHKCFLELDPKSMEGSPSDASSIKGANRHGEPVHQHARSHHLPVPGRSRRVPRRAHLADLVPLLDHFPFARRD